MKQQNESMTDNLLTELKKMAYLYHNPHQVIVNWADVITVSSWVWEKQGTMCLAVEFEPEEFLQAFDIKSAFDVNTITVDQLWSHFRAGKGFLTLSLDFSPDGGFLKFRVENGNTVIKGEGLAYLDNVPEILDNVTAIRDYMRKNIQKLYIAMEDALDPIELD
ncbi:hypothetical protein ACXZ1K_15925 [Pedobacter sp. PWIIR3]